MGLPQLAIPGFDGLSHNVPLANAGRQAATDSSAVVLSTEDLAAINSLATLLAAIDGHVDGLEGFTDGLETLIAATNTALAAANASLDNIEAVALDTATDSPVAVHQPCDIITVTPTLDTSVYASGDILFTATVVTNALRANDLCGLIQSLVVIDKDDQKPEFALKFWSANVAYGTINAAPSISDAAAVDCLGRINIVAADYDDDGGVSTAFKDGINKLIKAASGTRNIYITGKLTAGTPTHTASGLVIRLGIVQG